MRKDSWSLYIRLNDRSNGSLNEKLLRWQCRYFIYFIYCTSIGKTIIPHNLYAYFASERSFFTLKCSFNPIDFRSSLRRRSFLPFETTILFHKSKSNQIFKMSYNIGRDGGWSHSIRHSDQWLSSFPILGKQVE